MEAASKLSGVMQKTGYVTQENILLSELPTAYRGDNACVYPQVACIARFLSLHLSLN